MKTAKLTIKKLIVVTFAMLALSGLLLSCGGSGGGLSGSTKVTLYVKGSDAVDNAPATASAQQKGVFWLQSASGVPDGIGCIIIAVTGPDMKGISRSVNVTSGQSVISTILEVPNGPKRFFTVKAQWGRCGGGGEVFYQGSFKADLEGRPVTLGALLSYIGPGYDTGLYGSSGDYIGSLCQSDPASCTPGGDVPFCSEDDPFCDLDGIPLCDPFDTECEQLPDDWFCAPDEPDCSEPDWFCTPGEDPECTDDPCLLDPSAPGCSFDPCLENPDDPACSFDDPCLEDPLAPGCFDDPCLEDPDDPACSFDDPCLEDPLAPGCFDDPCLEDPLAPGCFDDPCLEDPLAPGCFDDPCLEDPLAPGCFDDPCAIDPYACGGYEPPPYEPPPYEPPPF